MGKNKNINKNKITSLESRLLTVNDEAELKSIVGLFNSNLQKKEVLRMNTLSQLQDKILCQIDKRLEAHADEFENKDLINYFKILHDASVSTSKVDDIPQIQYNQQVNVITQNDTPLNRESRAKITEIVSKILSDVQSTNIKDES